MRPKPKRSARLTHAGKVLWILHGPKIDVYVVDDLGGSFRLTKADGVQYTVGADGSCCCADANYRKRACKHVLGMRAVGLLSKEK